MKYVWTLEISYRNLKTNKYEVRVSMKKCMRIVVDLEICWIDVYDGKKLVSRLTLDSLDEDEVDKVVGELGDLLDHLNIEYEVDYI